jgi:hypothetical protein
MHVVSLTSQQMHSSHSVKLECWLPILHTSHTHTHTHTHIRALACMHAHTHTRARIHARTHASANTHTHMRAHAHHQISNCTQSLLLLLLPLVPAHHFGPHIAPEQSSGHKTSPHTLIRTQACSFCRTCFSSPSGPHNVRIGCWSSLISTHTHTHSYTHTYARTQACSFCRTCFSSPSRPHNVRIGCWSSHISTHTHTHSYTHTHKRTRVHRLVRSAAPVSAAPLGHTARRQGAGHHTSPHT